MRAKSDSTPLEDADSFTPDLRDEKSALQGISAQTRDHRPVESFRAEEEPIEKAQSALDELHKQLDDPVTNTASERYDRHDVIKADPEEMKDSGDKTTVGTTFLHGL